MRVNQDRLVDRAGLGEGMEVSYGRRVRTQAWCEAGVKARGKGRSNTGTGLLIGVRYDVRKTDQAG